MDGWMGGGSVGGGKKRSYTTAFLSLSFSALELRWVVLCILFHFLDLLGFLRVSAFPPPCFLRFGRTQVSEGKDIQESGQKEIERLSKRPDAWAASSFLSNVWWIWWTCSREKVITVLYIEKSIRSIYSFWVCSRFYFWRRWVRDSNENRHLRGLVLRLMGEGGLAMVVDV